MDEHTKAFTQLSYIIARMDKNVKNRIPLDVRKAISQKKDNSYIFYYDNSLPLYKQNLLPETKSLLSVIYSEYICLEKEKEKWNEYDSFKRKMTDDKALKNKEVEEKYDVDKLFTKAKNNKSNIVDTRSNTQSVEMVEIKESVLKKVWNKILNMFTH